MFIFYIENAMEWQALCTSSLVLNSRLWVLLRQLAISKFLSQGWHRGSVNSNVVICGRSKPRANTWCLWGNASKFIWIFTLELYSKLQEVSLPIREGTLGSQAKIMSSVITTTALAINASCANNNRRNRAQQSYACCIHTADEFPCIRVIIV